MTHAYLHAVTLSNVLPKRDENGDDYTPYNRLSGGMANADLFYPFGTIGYFVDPTKSKLAPEDIRKVFDPTISTSNTKKAFETFVFRVEPYTPTPNHNLRNINQNPYVNGWCSKINAHM